MLKEKQWQTVAPGAEGLGHGVGFSPQVGGLGVQSHQCSKPRPGTHSNELWPHSLAPLPERDQESCERDLCVQMTIQCLYQFIQVETLKETACVISVFLWPYSCYIQHADKLIIMKLVCRPILSRYTLKMLLQNLKMSLKSQMHKRNRITSRLFKSWWLCIWLCLWRTLL